MASSTAGVESRELEADGCPCPFVLDLAVAHGIDEIWGSIWSGRASSRLSGGLQAG
jgi:hypothetical protein